MLTGYKTILASELIHQPRQIKYYIEIGMSVTQAYRDYLKASREDYAREYLKRYATNAY
jgi:hypothetical protein